MNNQRLKLFGKYLSLLLRHSPEKENLVVNKHGYVEVSELCFNLKINREELDWIVENDNKERFSYSDDEKMIRANQGHSFEVDYGYKLIEPPELLFHGTSFENKKSINKDGLLSMSRQHVHLTEDITTAKQVGLRHSKNLENLWLISINAKKMFQDGYQFYKSKNNVYLTNNVPPKYLKQVK
jgi:putative RNA 2'-phosphotransferase